MKRTVLLIGCIIVLQFALTAKVFSHCQIPCGIYDDKTRFVVLKEDIATIEKAIKETVKLSGEKEINYNQIVRWINTKEDHANSIMETAAQYFLAQRIKLPEKQGADEKYNKELSALHSIIVYAMKTKQSLDINNVTALSKLVEEFEKLYFPQ